MGLATSQTLWYGRRSDADPPLVIDNQTNTSIDVSVCQHVCGILLV